MGHEKGGWTIRAQQVLTENPWFRVLESRVVLPDGGETTYFTVDHRRAAVGVVPRRAGEILLIHQYRFIVDTFVWAIPSGGCETDEDGRAAAERELVEETGYRARTIRPLQTYYPSYGSGNQVFHLFEAEVEDEPSRAFDGNEVLEVRWFPHAAVRELLDRGGIVDGLSLTPLLLLRAREGW